METAVNSCEEPGHATCADYCGHYTLQWHNDLGEHNFIARDVNSLTRISLPVMAATFPRVQLEKEIPERRHAHFALASYP